MDVGADGPPSWGIDQLADLHRSALGSGSASGGVQGRGDQSSRLIGATEASVQTGRGNSESRGGIAQAGTVRSSALLLFGPCAATPKR